MAPPCRYPTIEVHQYGGLAARSGQFVRVIVSREYRQPDYESQWDKPDCYSSRSATNGSIRDARHAGIRHALNATTPSAAATAPNVTGSRGWTPYSKVASSLLS